MSTNYDPDSTPAIGQELIAEARATGMQIAHFICDEESEKVGDATGVSFFAIVQALPRLDERVELQDGKVCVVKDVIWRVIKRQKTGSTMLVPNVVAIWTEGQGYENV